MLQYKTPEQLANDDLRKENEIVDNNKASQGNAPHNTAFVDSLSGYVRNKWEIAKRHKLQVQDRLVDCLRRRKGQYSPSKEAEIKGSKIYMKITAAKCIGAKSWLADLFNSSGDKPFTLAPTPIPDLPPEIHETLIAQAMQGALQLGLPEEDAYELMKKHEGRLKGELMDEAEKRMEKMEDAIEDMLVEGGWRKSFNEFLDDLTTYPTAIISGINFKQRKEIKWMEIDGDFVPKEEFALRKEFNRVSPFDAYPSPSFTNGHCSWFCERVRYSPKELTEIRNAAGYSKEAIYSVLSEYRESGFKEWLFNDSERVKLETASNYSEVDYELIDGVKFNGTIQGQQLTSWGLKSQKPIDPVQEYSVSVVVIGNHVIRALINPDPSARINYYSASWRTIPNSFWGEALPETIADIQDAANATARALMNNMSLGSSPMISADVSKMPNGKIPTIAPLKVYAYDSSKNGMSSGAGIDFFQFDMRSNELLNVYERFVRYADEISGIPSYAFGSDSGAGAAKTASGLSMLMNAAGKNMKNVVRNVDIGVIEPCISHAYNILMLDPETPKEIKGDAKVVARGSDALMHKESQAMRQQELLAMTNNPTDLQLTGLDGRRELFKNVLKSSDLPFDKIIMSQEQMMQQQQQQMAAQEQQQGDPNAK